MAYELQSAVDNAVPYLYDYEVMVAMAEQFLPSEVMAIARIFEVAGHPELCRAMAEAMLVGDEDTVALACQSGDDMKVWFYTDSDMNRCFYHAVYPHLNLDGLNTRLSARVVETIDLGTVLSAHLPRFKVW